MAFSKTATLCFTALLAAASLLSAGAQPPPVSPFCTTAEDKSLCMEFVKDGKTWEEAMTNALHGAINKVKAAGQPVVDNIPVKLPTNLEPQFRDQIAQDCKEGFQDVIDNFEMAFALVKNDPTEALKIRIGAPAFSQCYEDIGGNLPPMPEARQLGEEISKISEAVLAVAGKKPR